MTEPARHELYSRLIELLGPEPAETLMSHLPPTGWADVATVHTQQQLADQLRAEMRALGSDLRTEMGELRGEMGGLRSELRGEISGEISGLRVELHDGLRRQTYAMLGAMVSISGVVAAGAALG